MVSQKPKYCKSFERNSHWRKLYMIMVWERYTVTLLQNQNSFFVFVYIFVHISANMSPFRLKFSQMILHTKTSKLIYHWSFLFVVLHKPTLLPSTFNLFNAFKQFLYFLQIFARLSILPGNLHNSWEKELPVYFSSLPLCFAFSVCFFNHDHLSSIPFIHWKYFFLSIRLGFLPPFFLLLSCFLSFRLLFLSNFFCYSCLYLLVR